MDKQRFLRRLDKSWSDFKASYAGLSEAQMTQPGVTGVWSVRDILAHVTTWEEEALNHLPVILHGGKPPRYSVKYGGIDAFNALMTGRKSGLPLSVVLQQLDATHCRLVEYLMTVPEEHLAGQTRFRRRLRLDTYGHYPKHARAISEWRMQRALMDSAG